MRTIERIVYWWMDLDRVVQILVTISLGIILIITAVITLSDSAQVPHIREPEPIHNPTPPAPVVIQEPPEPEPPEEEEYIEEPEPGPVSILTGLALDEPYLSRRPMAVVINNSVQALPQSGITNADIVYEVLAEGAVTRFVAIFQSYLPTQIGPVRSARDYFIDMALNHDAIFIHHGGSPGAYQRVRSLLIDALDGMTLEGRVFYRDRTYPAWTGNTATRALEHSSYTSRERLENHFETIEMRQYVDEGEFGFGFDPPPDAVQPVAQATRIEVPFSSNHVRIFAYEDGQYLVYSNRGPHQDALNQAQMSVTNVIVQLASMRVIDYAGRRAVDTVGEGRGLLFTGGYVYDLVWVKPAHDQPMRWYFAGGRNRMMLNPGQTWICVFHATGEVLFE